jgi:SRSO17 transposase
MERMEEFVEDFCYQDQQQFLSDSPWDHHAVFKQVAQDVDRILGGADSVLVIDESGFEKKGKQSVGVARQWNGRLGKVDNSQVGVFSALSNGDTASLVTTRLYLPDEWTDDPARCEKAKIPKDRRDYKTKIVLAWEMIEESIANGLRFEWVAFDALYGNSPWLLRKIEAAGLTFVGDVHCDQHLYLENPEPYLPERKGPKGRQPKTLRARSKSIKIETAFSQLETEQWQTVKVREGTKGDIQVEAARMRVWFWDGKEQTAKCWWAVCLRSGGEIKYFVSNAKKAVSLTKLIRQHAARFWIERCFQDAKTSLGMADYQSRGWIAWHHHMALVAMAMLFALQERKLHLKSLDLITFTDIVVILDHYLPRTDQTEAGLIRNIQQRHRKRRIDIERSKNKSKKAKSD